jgi:hypothetical protein
MSAEDATLVAPRARACVYICMRICVCVCVCVCVYMYEDIYIYIYIYIYVCVCVCVCPSQVDEPIMNVASFQGRDSHLRLNRHANNLSREHPTLQEKAFQVTETSPCS